jgi:hypothetical protein
VEIFHSWPSGSRRMPHFSVSSHGSDMLISSGSEVKSLRSLAYSRLLHDPNGKGSGEYSCLQHLNLHKEHVDYSEISHRKILNPAHARIGWTGWRMNAMHIRSLYFVPSNVFTRWSRNRRK